MGAGSKRKPTDLFMALAHPLRRRVLRTLIAEGSELSPRDLARSLDEHLSALSYHVRVLEECGAVKQTRIKRVRGAKQHFYRSSLRTDWARVALKATKDPPEKSRRRGEEKG